MKSIKSAIDLVPVILLILAPSVRLMVPGLNAIVLFAFIPCIFIWASLKYNSCYTKKSIKYYIALIVWLLFTTLTSTNIPSSLSIMKTIGAGFLISVVFYSLASSKTNNGLYLLFAYIILLITTIWYLWQSGELLSLDITKERLDDELVNANDLAYYLFYVSCSVYILFYFSNLKRIWFVVTMILLIALAFSLSIVTASRQILIIVVPYILYCIYSFLLYDSKHKTKRIMVFILVLGIAFFALVPQIQGILSGSFLEARMEIEIEDDSRTALLQDAIRVGLEHPLLGVGPGNLIYFSNDGGFSHNSYAELFSTSGIPSLILFILMVFPFIVENRRRFKITKDKFFLFLFWTSLLWAAYNVLYVFYHSLWLIGFYYLIMGISSRYYSQCITQKSI